MSALRKEHSLARGAFDVNVSCGLAKEKLYEKACLVSKVLMFIPFVYRPRRSGSSMNSKSVDFFVVSWAFLVKGKEGRLVTSLQDLFLSCRSKTKAKSHTLGSLKPLYAQGTVSLMKSLAASSPPPQ